MTRFALYAIFVGAAVAAPYPAAPTVKLWTPKGLPAVSMPVTGLGTAFGWSPPGNTTTVRSAVALYLRNGGRAIHTAWMYCNLASVGAGIRDSGVPRDEIFVMGMLPQWSMGYEETIDSFNDTLRLLGLDRLDLYMYHWPGVFPQNMPMLDPPHVETCGQPVMQMPACKRASWGWKQCRLESWRAMTELQASGKIGALGVSNFDIEQMEELHNFNGNRPSVNQVEFHIGFHDDLLAEYGRNESVVLQAYSPLAGGHLANPPNSSSLSRIATAHNKTAAQVALRFIAQSGVAAVPKASTDEYQRENLAIFDFELSSAEMIELGALASPNKRGVADAMSMMCVDEQRGRMARCTYVDIYG